MLTTAQVLKKGSFIKHGDQIQRILDHTYHIGGGKMGGMVTLKIQDLGTGHVHELKVDPHEKIEELETERHKMKYLYADSTGLCFMDPKSFEQVTIPREALEAFIPYLKEDVEMEVELYEGNPIHVNLPEKIVLEVVSTGAPKKGETDSCYKPATLENDMEVLVPQFIKAGDKVCVNVETGKYVDRV